MTEVGGKQLDKFDQPTTSNFICSRLKEIRKQAGMTQTQFGKAVGVGLPYIKGIEQQRFAPAHEVLFRVAQEFKRSMDWIYGLKS